ncbi:MAG: NAD(P)/FAD-dependent oxidoreductase [Solirubrobacteraceae bacterium]
MKRTDADVLIAGGGLAAQRCCQTLRRHGFDGRIVVLCAEREPPYDRPPLSKSVLASHHPQELAYKPLKWYAENDIHLLLGTSATELHTNTRTVVTQEHDRARDGRIRYRRLVIATGGLPRQLPGLALGGVVGQLRTHADALALRTALMERRGRLAVVGAGLIGMEVASSALSLGLEVTLIEAGATPLARVLPASLGRWMATLHRRHGIDVRLATTVTRLSPHDRTARLALSDGSTVTADTVLIATGTVAATDWLASSPLGQGLIPTDAAGRTVLSDVYAAGDAACFPDPYTGEQIATPHWEAAARQGTAVARAIVGLPVQPALPAMFWTDQHGHRIQLVGHAQPDSDIHLNGNASDDEPFAARLTHHGHPSGVLLLDQPELLPAAREWITSEHANEREQGLAA